MTQTLVDSAETDALLCKAHGGDRLAFERLLERHEPAVRGVIGRRLSPRLRSRIDGSDIVQETRQYAFTHLDDYLERRPMPFRLWLLKTAHQKLRDIERDHLAAAKRSARREVPLPDQSSIDLVGALVGRTPSPSNEVARGELAETVRQCLAELSETDREILFLRNFDGLSNPEAAALLELKPETTKKRCTRALLRLRSLLEQAGITEAQI